MSAIRATRFEYKLVAFRYSKRSRSFSSQRRSFTFQLPAYRDFEETMGQGRGWILRLVMPKPSVWVDGGVKGGCIAPMRLSPRITFGRTLIDAGFSQRTRI